MTLVKNKTITIVGGGTAGLVTALILATRLNNKIKVIKSDKIGIVGVGEGSTEHWEDFMNVCDIDVFELIKETDATVKLGIYFKDWTEKPYFHNVTSFNQTKIGQFPAGLALNYVEGKEQIYCTDYYTLDSKVEFTTKEAPSRQFHFNTFKLVAYLTKKCKAKGVEIIEDEILDVIVDKDGINSLIGEKQTYKSDFYIDCTGFAKLLITKLGAKWVSYRKYLKLNEVIAFPTEETDEYTPFTTATAMNSGWMFRLPVWGRWGNGYIYDNNFCTKDQAVEEVEKHIGKKIEVGRHLHFDPGALDKAWIKNCMASGLGANFVEPLEASSIATTIHQAFVFLNHFFPDNQKEIDTFNNKMNVIMSNIKDFIALHYQVKRKDTDFWKNIKTVNIPDTLKEKLDVWKYRMAINDDFKDINYCLFRDDNFNCVLYGLGLFDKECIKKEIQKYTPSLIQSCRNKNRKYKKDLDEVAKTNYISHKEWLSQVRTIYH